MTLLLETPVKLRLIGYDNQVEELEKHLRYTDKSIEFEIQRLKKSPWQKQKLGTQAFNEKIEDLQAQKTKSLLFTDDQGLWTYSGFATRLSRLYNEPVTKLFTYPEAKLIPYFNPPSKTPRPYQTLAHDKLIASKHGGVEQGTGTGKTLEQIMLLKSLGLKSLLMTPSLNIAEQTHEQMVSLFGKKYVGAFFDGTKQSDKLFVVGVAQSLSKVEPGTVHYNNLQNTQVFIADESHQCPAKTLAKVCFDLVGNAPYRFFFSGTQTRTDGSDLLLEGITGDIVFTMTVQEGVDQGYLAKPIFRMIKVNSNQYCNSDDANTLTRKHVYYNPQVLQTAADLINKCVVKLNRPTLVLIDEFAQFTKLLPYLRVEAKFAHGGVSEDNKKKIAERFHDSDPKQLVDDFNGGKFPCLIGTSCISTGTDIQAAQAIIYLKGGKSEIEVKQAVGRGTRLYPGKKDCMVFDFGIMNVPTLERHAKARKKLYKEIYPDYAEIKL